jgi:hypothetical protein
MEMEGRGGHQVELRIDVIGELLYRFDAMLLHHAAAVRVGFEQRQAPETRRTC